MVTPDVEPILLKGWSVGRFYPDPSLRQLGDIDLLVRDEELPTAEKALSEEKALYIDWHPVSALKAEFTDPERIFDRSERVSLLSAEIGVLCPEDSLHLVAIHMLRHAGWSPHWISPRCLGHSTAYLLTSDTSQNSRTTAPTLSALRPALTLEGGVRAMPRAR